MPTPVSWPLGAFSNSTILFILLNELNENLLDFAYIYSPNFLRFLLINQTTFPLTTFQLKSSTMKYSVVALAVALVLATSALAAPPASPAPPAEVVNGGGAEIEETCYHASSCSDHWSGLCEDYCGSRGFSHMSGSGCGWFSKKCCCNRN